MEKKEILESDPTYVLRKKLVDSLRVHVTDESDARALESFEKGTFLIPSETLTRVVKLIERVSEEGDRKELQRVYGEILNQA